MDYIISGQHIAQVKYLTFVVFISNNVYLSRLLNQSERLTEEYLDLFGRYLNGDNWPQIYVDLLEQLRALYPSKKGVK